MAATASTSMLSNSIKNKLKSRFKTTMYDDHADNQVVNLQKQLGKANQQLKKLSGVDQTELDDALNFLQLKKDGIIGAEVNQILLKANQKLTEERFALQQELDQLYTDYVKLQKQLGASTSEHEQNSHKLSQQIDVLDNKVQYLTQARANLHRHLTSQGMSSQQIGFIENGSHGVMDNKLMLTIVKLQNLVINVPVDRIFVVVDLFNVQHTSSPIIVSTPLSGVICNIAQSVSFSIPFTTHQQVQQLKAGFNVYLKAELLHTPDQLVILGMAIVRVGDQQQQNVMLTFQNQPVGTIQVVTNFEEPLPVEVISVEPVDALPGKTVPVQEDSIEKVKQEIKQLSNETPPFGSQDSITDAVVADLLNEDDYVPVQIDVQDPVEVKQQPLELVKVKLSKLNFDKQMIKFFKEIKMQQFFLDFQFEQQPNLSFESESLKYDGLSYDLDIQVKMTKMQFQEQEGKFEVTLVKEPSLDQSDQQCIDFAICWVDLFEQKCTVKSLYDLDQNILKDYDVGTIQFTVDNLPKLKKRMSMFKARHQFFEEVKQKSSQV